MSKDAPEIYVLDKKVRLLQVKDGFRTSLDSVFVAAACPATRGRILDLGCGVGGASFCLLYRLPDVQVTGIDVQQSHIDLAQENIIRNDAAGRADFITGDIKHFKSQMSFDHVICNPPFLEAGEYTPSPSLERAAALGHKNEDMVLDDWIKAAHRALKEGGSLTLIHRADKADKIIQALGHKFGATEVIPLWPRAGLAAKRVIIRTRKGRKSPAVLHPGLILHEKDGSYTKEADAILRNAHAIS